MTITAWDNLHDKCQYCYTGQGNEALVETVSNTQQGYHSTESRNYQQLLSAHALAEEKDVNLLSEYARLRLTSMRMMGGKVIRTLTTVTPKDMYGPRSGKDLASILLL